MTVFILPLVTALAGVSRCSTVSLSTVASVDVLFRGSSADSILESHLIDAAFLRLLSNLFLHRSGVVGRLCLLLAHERCRDAFFIFAWFLLQVVFFNFPCNLLFIARGIVVFCDLLAQYEPCVG